ncbi:MAG TPA: endonuclease domain-containing protein [Sphingomonas sp.]|nr:endonuclease domain-containing protein [Sphingomonas sp.]
MLGKPGKTVRRARRLRRELLPPEIALWSALRTRPGDLKFRRQHPAGRYSLDFYCAAARLAIEVDGEVHGRGDHPERDAARDGLLLAHGVETLRIPAVEVLCDLDGVIRGIVAAALARLPLHHPAAPGGPPPQAELGED